MLGITATAADKVKISVVMNSVSRSMTLADADNESVDVGTPDATVATKVTYTFEVEPGSYTMSAFDANQVSTGTLVLDVPAFDTTFNIATVTAYLTNKDTVTPASEGTAAVLRDWVIDTDYTIPVEKVYAASRAGIRRVITLGYNEARTRAYFNMITGDTYTVWFKPDEEKHPGFLEDYRAATVTANVATAASLLTKYIEYTITVPKGADLYVGKKTLTHYVPFQEMEPVKKETVGEKDVYTFHLGGGKQTYNYRVTIPGAMTHASKFGYSDQYKKYSFELTKEEMIAHGDKDYFNHNVHDNKMGNLADVYLNINKYGYLDMQQGDQHQIVAQRVWQLIDDQSNNYFVEPDYHYTVLNENFEESSDVVTVDENGLLKAVGKGTAIVQVRYDAMYVHEYNRVDAFGNWGKDLDAWFGALYSCIWPENTGTFVVTVDEAEDPALKANFFINTTMAERVKEDSTIDSEIDILYYIDGEPGYYYTFKPEGAASVEVANPKVDTVANTLAYPDGFSAKNVTKADDGTYRVLLTYGRNIIRVTSGAGVDTYQVLSAKPMRYTVKNVTRPDADVIYPGDSLYIQMAGLFHPAMKLSGIYNHSAYIHYNGIINGDGSLILSPNQYAFGGNPKAQLFTLRIPMSYDKEEYVMTEGVLQMKGFGSVAGKHRAIDRIAGVNPNFQAAVTTNYWGSLPDITLKVESLTDGFKFTGLPEGIEPVVLSEKNDTLKPNEEGVYRAAPGNYRYEVLALGYKAKFGELTLAEGEGIKNVECTLTAVAADDISWDGESIELPDTVTKAESDTEGGQFEGLSGYYKITNGYELAWFSYYINRGNSTTNAVLTRDIDLAGKAWTVISPDFSKQFSGVFDGGNHKVSGLFIDSEAGNQGLFGYVSNGTIRNLTVDGSVTSTGSNIGGIVGDLENGSVLENCHNMADVKGGSNVGGIFGYAYCYPTKEDAPMFRIENCSNSGDITATSRVGGIGGHVEMYNYRLTDGITVRRLSNTGKITSLEAAGTEYGSASVGGIFGEMYGVHLEDAYNTGEIVGDASYTSVGGLVGVRYAQKPMTTLVKNAYNFGKVSGGSIVGETYAVNTPDVTVLSLVNVYAVEGMYAEGDTVKLMPAAAFADGEMAWTLGAPFGQRLGEDTVPVFSDAAVYRVVYTNNENEDTDTLFTNGELPVIIDGKVATWFEEKDGAEVDGAITADATLYVEFSEVVPATGVALDKTEATMKIGETLTLTATVTPDDATDKSVTWSSSDDKIATVEEDGTVTAVAEGEAVITVKTTDGGYTAECKVTVEKPTVSATGVALDKTEATMKIGETLTLTATVTPDDATDKSVTWSSSDDKIATVDEDGTVTAVAEGEAVITVKTTDGGYTAECKVTVKDVASAVDGTSVIIGVYPNPFIDWFIVEVTEDTDAVLYTLSGQIVWSGRLTAGENTVETGSLPDGVYMLRAGDATYKLICGRR